MDMDLLRTYIAVVDTGSLTRAARQVHRTQAALSMQMKRLEEQAGCSLFFKEGRNLELTNDCKFHSPALDGLNKTHRPYRIKALRPESGQLGCRNPSGPFDD